MEHTRTAHNGNGKERLRRVKCDQCEKTFKRRDHMLRHAKSQHTVKDRLDLTYDRAVESQSTPPDGICKYTFTPLSIFTILRFYSVKSTSAKMYEFSLDDVLIYFYSMFRFVPLCTL